VFEEHSKQTEKELTMKNTASNRKLAAEESVRAIPHSNELPYR